MCPTCLCVRRFSQSSDEPRHRFPPGCQAPEFGPLVPHPSGAVLSRGAFSSPRRPRTARCLRPRIYSSAPNQRSANRRRLRLPLAADASGRACGATSLALSREGCRFCPNPRVHSPPLLSHRTLPLPPVLLSPAPATSSVRLFLVTQTLLICPCLKNSTARTRPTRHPRARGHPWPPCCQSPWPSPRLAAPASSVCTPPPPRGTVLRGDTLPRCPHPLAPHLALQGRLLPPPVSPCGGMPAPPRTPSRGGPANSLYEHGVLGPPRLSPCSNSCPFPAWSSSREPSLRLGCQQAPPLIKAFTPLDAPWMT